MFFFLDRDMAFFSNLVNLTRRLLNRGEVTLQDATEQGQPLADVLRDIYGDHVWRRARQEMDPNWQRWRELTPRYLKWKRDNGYSTKIGVMTGEMLGREQFMGAQATYSDNHFAFEYGVSESARRKMRYFQGGGRQVLGYDDDLKIKINLAIMDAQRTKWLPFLR